GSGWRRAGHILKLHASCGKFMHTWFMTLEFTVDPELTDELRAQIVACWTEVSNAGGAVGFVPPVTTDDVRPAAEKLFAAVAAGHDRLIVGWAVGSDNDEPGPGEIGSGAAGGGGPRV